MNLIKFVKELEAQHVKLFVEGEQLRCRAPKNVLTPDLLAKIKQYKSDLITLLQGSVDENSETYPLSHGQRALWFLYQLAPESAAYNINYVARLRADLELQALQQAFEKLVERHAILRTTYTTQDGEPIQQVHQAQSIHFKVTEANNWSQEDLTKWLAREADRPFNLEQGPVLRIELLLGFSEPALPILSVTMHHIVADFWSFEILINELESLYQAIQSETLISLPPLKWSYKDYVRWETEMLASPRGKQLWVYWQKQLGGELPVLNLPTDHPRPPVQTYNGTTATFDVDESLNQQMMAFSKAIGSTPYVFMLTVFQILLQRYTGQEEILIGTPMSGRHTTELQELIGYFVNPVVLRHQLHGNPTFEELLQRLRQQVVEALDHQEYPFGLLVEQLQPIRDPSRSPLYQVALVWDKERHQDTSNRNASKLVTEILSAEQRGAAFDLSLTFFEQAGHLRGEWTYNTELFEESTINRFTGHLKTLVAAALAHPQQRLSELPLLTEAEQQQLLAWNNIKTDYPMDKTIVDLFEEQVEKTPLNIAVVFEQRQLTYQQLNEQANRLAHYLLEIKNQASLPDNPLIAIAVERSIEMVIGLLGILKAGGAYVPIDPSYPAARLQYMLEDSRTPVLLTQSHLKTQRPVLAHDCVIVCLDEGEFANQPIVNPTIKRFSTDLAYVIYTSGSTGRPKGCQVTHANVTRLFACTEAWYQFNQQDVWTLFHSYAFDFSVWEIWGALFYGAKLVVVPHETSRSPADFYQLLIQQQVTVLNQTPSAFGQLIEMDEQPDKLVLRLVIFGGEALDFNQLQPWFARHGEKQPQLINMYGITETTVHVTYYPLLQPHSSNQSIIGIPLPDLCVWVVDEHHQPLPVGVPGEMLVGGAGVTNGYLNRPELTAEKFIEIELFGKTERIYKTGDLARWLPDGNLEYLGRIDHQVKLRGFRIELGEIEAVLSQHELIKEAVVIVYEADDIKRLVAYLTAESETYDLVTIIKDWLKVRLPEYMVPSQFMVLDKLPLTHNGKIDRKALPAPLIETTTGTQLLTPTEELLGSLWANVLKLKSIHRDDNFFELGGHSLLATQLIARIRDAFQVELPVQVVFEEPTLSQLATKIEEASREVKLPPISRQPSSSKKVLSFAQQRLWFLNQFEDQQQSTYNIPVVLRLEGDLDRNTLQQSLFWLLERHDSLRCAFPTKDGQAQVQILDLDKFEVLKIHDLTELSAETQQLEVQNLANRHAIEPFDLQSGPLFKVELLLLSERESVLLLNMHHIISDGWSMGLFIRDWQHAYTAFAQGEQPSLPPLSIQYSDYAAWQRDWLQGEILQQQVDYWREQLAGAPELLELPTDKLRPAQQSYQGAHYRQSLSPTLSQAVNSLSREQGISLFMTLLSTFEILLSRYARQMDVCVGSPIANRTHRQSENMIGCFVNTLVLRAQLQPDLSVIELLRANRQTCLEAYAHQDIPFEMLVEQLQPTRNLSHSPLFQVMLVLQNNEATDLTLPGLEITALEPDYPISKFDLTLVVEERNEQLYCFWEYATDLFSLETIELLSSHFEMLLTAIAENPEQVISQLPMLTPQEIQQLLTWNDTATDYPADKTIVDLFEEQVEKTPSNIAVVFEQQQLSYQQLNEQANRLAHYLLEIKNQASLPDNCLIAIAVERSIEMVTGLLGILKAGGAYVPIDPSYPVARIQYMLEDSKAPVLLTQSHLKAQLPVLTHDCVTVCLDDFEFANQPTVNPTTKRFSMDLAYVIYTSGSTGRPKGVAIEHMSAVELIQWANKIYEPIHLAGVLASTSICFDLSLFELFVPLSQGGCTIVVQDALQLPQINQTVLPVTLINTVPSVATALLNTNSIPSTVQVINLAGEPLKNHLVQALYQRTKVQKIYNLYGPSEDTTYSTFLHVAQGLLTEPTIGKPIANTRIYILDTQHQVQPIGIPGELCIAGHGLARGYLNRPELTAEKFIEVELLGKTERIYKTGDLARWLPDGNLEYFGRIDHQVKLRGFRIELGEIEAVLSQHEFVKEAVVILYEADENKRLVAYLIIEKATHDLVTIVKDELKARLPDYMVPSQFIVLEQLPLTPNGKIDRKALPTPSIETSSSTQLITPTEELLAHLWATVLKLKAVSRDDNFFELGGHSLLATQLIARIREVFEVELPVRAVFEEPKLSQLATKIEEASREIKLPPISTQPASSKKVLSFAQQRLWFLNQFEDQNTATYNMPVSLRLQGDLKVAALQQSLSWLLERHQNLRSAFPTFEGKAQLQILPLDKIEVLKIHDFTELPTERQRVEVQNRTNFHAIEPFDLSQGPLFKADLFTLSANDAVFLLNMHHIISDGWSMALFIREWQHAYTAFAQGEQPSLPPLTIQYSDYAAWQRDWLQGELLQQQVDYWRSQLAGAPELLELPTDKARPAQQSYQGAHYSQSLSPTLSEAIKRLSRSQGVTLFMTLLTTFDILLSRYSGQTDLCVGSPIANRTQRQTENLMGFLVNTLVLRAQLQPTVSFLELLRANRQTCLEAYTHQDIPFEMLVEQLRPTRSLSHSPLFQVMLVLQNNESSDLTLPGLEISAIKQEYPIAKFDLTLSVNEQNEQLHCLWEYATDLFSLETIELLSSHFEMLLTAIAENPEQAISQLPMLTEKEVQQLLAWNNSATDYPMDKTIVDLFEEQVEKTPSNIAVVFEQQQLSYQQINEQANQLAYYLLKLKNQTQMPDNPLIAIAVDRSVEMVIGLLGILKAAGAYVPIDPSYPTVRIQYMLEDSAAGVLLTQSHLQAQLLALTHDSLYCVCLDDFEFANQPAVNPTIKPLKTDLAYVIYTSGSTGMPKGVMIEHHNLSNLLLNLQQSTGMTVSDKLLAVTTLSFDIAALELYLPLISGSLLQIVTRERASDGFALQQLLKHHNFMQATPATWKLLMQSDWIAETPLNILCGGEALPPELANFLLENSHRLWNVYGPTETTIWSSAYLIQTVSNALVSIGKPIANTHIYILDPQHQVQPPGIPGELCIAGAGLARGYLNRPELTAEKFIEVELLGKTERIYKTGDLARWLPDGNLEYLGRIDHQVKLRGFRIELGEIEAVLSQHEFVKEAVVILYEADDNQQLVAYLTIEKADNDLVSIVKDWLRASLPDYMVPSQFVILDQLPLTPNGKIDRQALEQLSVDTSSFKEESFIAPRDTLELQLTAIWEAILNIHPIGVRDNFFELGGHSLLAVRLMAQIQQQFGNQLPLATLFQSPTIESLVSFLRQQTDSQHGSPLVAIHTGGNRLPFFCVHPVGGNVFCYMDLARHLGTEQPFYGLQSPGLNGEVEPLSCIEEMATQYIDALQTIQPQGPYQLGGWSLGGIVAFEMAQQLRQQGHEVGLLALIDSYTPTTINFPEEIDEATLIAFLAHDIGGLFGKNLSVDELKQIEPEKHLNAILEQAKMHNLLPPGIEALQMRHLLRVFKANWLALSRYRPHSYPGQITLFTASQPEKPEDRGWNEFATGCLEIHQLSGDHYTLIREPNVKRLAEKLITLFV